VVLFVLESLEEPEELFYCYSFLNSSFLRCSKMCAPARFGLTILLPRLQTMPANFQKMQIKYTISHGETKHLVVAFLVGGQMVIYM
jgi:hypothetical protein